MKCFISVVHQHSDDLRIGRSAIPKGSVWRGWKDAWFLASFAAGGGGCSRSFHFFVDDWKMSGCEDENE